MALPAFELDQHSRALKVWPLIWIGGRESPVQVRSDEIVNLARHSRTAMLGPPDARISTEVVKSPRDRPSGDEPRWLEEEVMSLRASPPQSPVNEQVRLH